DVLAPENSRRASSSPSWVNCAPSPLPAFRRLSSNVLHNQSAQAQSTMPPINTMADVDRGRSASSAVSAPAASPPSKIAEPFANPTNHCAATGAIDTRKAIDATTRRRNENRGIRHSNTSVAAAWDELEPAGSDRAPASRTWFVTRQSERRVPAHEH